MNLTKENTKILQGIAILFMFALHLYNRADISNYYNLNITIGNEYLLTYVSYFFDACVPIYLFCSGYGLYKSINSNHGKFDIKSNIERIFKLLIKFWIIVIVTCIIGYSLGMKKIYPGNLINFILNMLLLKSSYIGSFWFVQTYTLLVLLSGITYVFIKNKSKYMIFISFVLYILAFVIEYILINQLNSPIVNLTINMVMLLFRSQFSFVIGMLFARDNKIEQSKLIIYILKYKYISWLILLIIIIIRYFSPHMFFAPFSAIIFIIVFGKYIWSPYIKKALLFFGKHSTNMWLTHMQFYMIFAPNLIFWSKNVFIIMATLLILSLISSYIIDFIYFRIMNVLKHH